MSSPGIGMDGLAIPEDLLKLELPCHRKHKRYQTPQATILELLGGEKISRTSNSSEVRGNHGRRLTQWATTADRPLVMQKPNARELRPTPGRERSLLGIIVDTAV